MTKNSRAVRHIVSGDKRNQNCFDICLNPGFFCCFFFPPLSDTEDALFGAVEGMMQASDCMGGFHIHEDLSLGVLKQDYKLFIY